MNFAGVFRAMFSKAFLVKQSHRLLNHVGVAAQENVRIGRRGLKTPGLGHKSLPPQILHKSGGASPGDRLIGRRANGGNIGEVAAQMLEG